MMRPAIVSCLLCVWLVRLADAEGSSTSLLSSTSLSQQASSPPPTTYRLGVQPNNQEDQQGAPIAVIVALFLGVAVLGLLGIAAVILRRSPKRMLTIHANTAQAAQTGNNGDAGTLEEGLVPHGALPPPPKVDFAPETAALTPPLHPFMSLSSAAAGAQQHQQTEERQRHPGDEAWAGMGTATYYAVTPPPQTHLRVFGSINSEDQRPTLQSMANTPMQPGIATERDEAIAVGNIDVL